MATITRRKAVGCAAGAAALAVPHAVPAQAPAETCVPDPEAARWAAERASVMQLGFTADEAACWEHVAKAAALFFELPVLNELDSHEIAQATHVFQNKLLSRPIYQQYVELTKQQNATEQTGSERGE